MLRFNYPKFFPCCKKWNCTLEIFYLGWNLSQKMSYLCEKINSSHIKGTQWNEKLSQRVNLVLIFSSFQKWDLQMFWQEKMHSVCQLTQSFLNSSWILILAKYLQYCFEDDVTLLANLLSEELAMVIPFLLAILYSVYLVESLCWFTLHCCNKMLGVS